MQQLQQRTAAAFGLTSAPHGGGSGPTAPAMGGGGPQAQPSFLTQQQGSAGHNAPTAGHASPLMSHARSVQHISMPTPGADPGYGATGPVAGGPTTPIMGGPGQMGGDPNAAYAPLQHTHVPAEHAHVVHAILRALGGR